MGVAKSAETRKGIGSFLFLLFLLFSIGIILYFIFRQELQIEEQNHVKSNFIFKRYFSTAFGVLHNNKHKDTDNIIRPNIFAYDTPTSLTLTLSLNLLFLSVFSEIL